MTHEEFQIKTAAKRPPELEDTAEIPAHELPPQTGTERIAQTAAVIGQKAASIPPEVWVQIILAALDFLTKWLDRRRPVGPI